jgi:hypothetical protein
MDKEADPEKKQRHQYPFRLSGKGFESARKRKINVSDRHYDCEQKQLIRHRRLSRRENPLMSSRSLKLGPIVEIGVVADSRCDTAAKRMHCIGTRQHCTGTGQILHGDRSKVTASGERMRLAAADTCFSGSCNL